MKKIFVIFMTAALLLGLAGCGQTQEKKTVDLDKLYEAFQADLPEMLVMDDSFRTNLLGIDKGDCVQVITAICSVGLDADEIWLIEAKDTAALERIQVLADNRMKAKADETRDYVPGQYQIVQNGKVITRGLYLALLVSPAVDTLQAAFEDAVK